LRITTNSYLALPEGTDQFDGITIGLLLPGHAGLPALITVINGNPAGQTPVP
jgi:hypothetical protein